MATTRRFSTQRRPYTTLIVLDIVRAALLSFPRYNQALVGPSRTKPSRPPEYPLPSGPHASCERHGPGHGNNAPADKVKWVEHKKRARQFTRPSDQNGTPFKVYIPPAPDVPEP
ncbi:hypothetical protein B0H14DRAFT_2561113 [Mycena olivaceomarginata]|nr:hypothetical protein B0H14DRAFT_2561113 [Mycena olivaceomarginata]